jgi:hypothetical protein
VRTEGPKTEDGGQEAGSRSNVVPFPRDWLGPRDELVPFGSSAGDVAEIEATTPRADAFWGEESVAVHGVLGAPEPAVSNPAARFRGRASRLAAGGLVAALVAAAAFGKLAGAPTAGQSPIAGSGVSVAGFVDLALLRGAVGAPAIEPAIRAQHRPVRPQARAAPHKNVRRAQRVGAAQPSAAAAAQDARASTASTGVPVSSATGSSSGSQPTATSHAPAHSSVSSHAASVRPGPVGPGAPFGPGQLK